METLDDLAHALFGTNYAVYLAEVHFGCSQDLDVTSKVRMALSRQDVTIGNTWGVTKAEMLQEIDEKLHYDEGDMGSGPFKSNRPRAEALVTAYLNHLEVTVNEHDLIIGFWFREGHPAYPVYWTYAYLIESGQQNVLLIGSSSD